MAIDLSNLVITAEVVAVVENLVTLRDEVLIYIRWFSDGKEFCPGSFIVAEL